MISIKKPITEIPLKLNDAFSDSLQKQLLLEKNLHKFSSGVYRDSVIVELSKVYRNKCGYCETDTTAGAALRVDHYRPKNGITGESSHLGYYWLGYEWTNLILSCEKCNRYKSNFFPISGNRMFSPVLKGDGTLDRDVMRSSSDLLLQEGPLILNPEIDKIENHLTFISDGTAVGLSKRGQMTIDTCNLNREELVLKRKKLIDLRLTVLRKIILHFIVNQDEKVFTNSIKIFFTELRTLQHPKNTYSQIGYLLYSNFDFFFIDKLHRKYKPLLHILFEKFKSNNL